MQGDSLLLGPLLNKYMTDYVYSFKYDEVLKETKREAAKERKRLREEKLKLGGTKPKTKGLHTFGHSVGTEPCTTPQHEAFVVHCTSRSIRTSETSIHFDDRLVQASLSDTRSVSERFGLIMSDLSPWRQKETPS